MDGCMWMVTDSVRLDQPTVRDSSVFPPTRYRRGCCRMMMTPRASNTTPNTSHNGCCSPRIAPAMRKSVPAAAINMPLIRF